MTRRVTAAASLIPAVALFACSTRGLEAAAVLAAAALAAVALGGRWPAGIALQRLASGIALAVGVVAAQLLLAGAPGVAGRGGLGMLSGTAALAALLSAAVRRLFTAPEGDRRPEVALEAAALVACGMARVGPAYPVLVTAWLVLALAGWRAREPRLRPSLESRRPLALAGLAALAALSTLTLGLGLPRAARFAEGRLVRWLATRHGHVGFADAVRLGSLDRLLVSDQVVLRLWGPAVDYLRGNSYGRYAAGLWYSRGVMHRLRTAGVPPARGAVEVRFAGQSRYYFLPLGAREVATAQGEALGDDTGILRPRPLESPAAYWFVPGTESGARLAPPGPGDLEVPQPLAARLAPLAASWTAGQDTPRAKVEALAAQLLGGFTYDLEVRRPPGVDPVEEFLFRSRRGHCEYFASALALLARSAGVPARLVGGYRVAEANPFGGYRVVRERDAHAWVEAWLPGEGWRTFDATPDGLGSRHSSLLFALADAASTGLARGLAALRDRSPLETAALLATAVALFAAVRAWNARRAPRVGRDQAAVAPVPPWFERFLLSLARAGHVRSRAETLERFARRLATAQRPDAAELLERYAALRYGGQGDAGALARGMDACAEQLDRGADPVAR